MTDNGAPLAGPSARPPTPRWVRALGVLAALLLVLLLSALLLGGEHGPGQHSSAPPPPADAPAAVPASR